MFLNIILYYVIYVFKYYIGRLYNNIIITFIIVIFFKPIKKILTNKKNMINFDENELDTFLKGEKKPTKKQMQEKRNKKVKKLKNKRRNTFKKEILKEIKKKF